MHCQVLHLAKANRTRAFASVRLGNAEQENLSEQKPQPKGFPIEINNLHDIQKAVGGYIESVPFVFDRDDIAVYVNDEGKFTQMPNRAVFADSDITTWNNKTIRKGEVVDILFGPIVCLGSDAEGVDIDLTDEQTKLITDKFGADSIDSGLLAVLQMRRELAV